LLSVSRKRSQSLTELLHEDPQLQLGVGLNFTHTWQGLSIKVNQLRAFGAGRSKAAPVIKALSFH
jgi:hypothetical protein